MGALCKHTARNVSASLICAVLLLYTGPGTRVADAVKQQKVLKAAETVAPTVEEIGKKLWDLAKRIEPIPINLRRGGFSDVGDVSYITPTMGVSVPYSPKLARRE